MSEEQLKAFLEKAKGDTRLKEKLKAAADAKAVTVIAKEAGFNVSADNITQAQADLSDQDLEGVAGGKENEWWETPKERTWGHYYFENSKVILCYKFDTKRKPTNHKLYNKNKFFSGNRPINTNI